MSGVLAQYEALIAGGQLQPDAAQRAAAERLQRLQEELETPASKPGFFARCE